MDQKILDLELSIYEKNLYGLVHLYRMSHSDRPLWHLVEDIQQQIFVYNNIIEMLKTGESEAEVKKRFETELDLVRGVPNPHGVLDWALNKLRKYRSTLLDLMSEFGQDLVKELRFSEATATLSAQLGFPQITLSVGVEYTASVIQR